MIVKRLPKFKINPQYICWSVFFLFLVCWRLGMDTFQALWIERWMWLVVLLIVFTFTVPAFGKNISKAYLLFFAYLTLMTARHAFLAQTQALPDPAMQLLIHEASKGCLVLLGSACLFFLLPVNTKAFEWALRCSGFLVSGSIFYAWLKNGFHTPTFVPILSNPSMSATFVALTLAPFGSWIGLIAVLLSHSHTAILTYIVIGWGCSDEDVITKMGYELLAALGAIFFGVKTYLHGFADTGRFEIWRWYWDWFRHLPFLDQTFGVGMGTTRVWLPMVEMQHGWDLTIYPTYLWAHNDWLQLLIELGWVGFGLFLLMALFMLVDLSTKYRWWAIGFGCAMFTNFPVHYAPLAIIGWYLVGHAAIWDSKMCCKELS